MLLVCFFSIWRARVSSHSYTHTHTHSRSLRIWTTKQIRISFMTAWGVVCFTLEIIYDCIELCVNNVGWHVIRVNRLYIFFFSFPLHLSGFFCVHKSSSQFLFDNLIVKRWKMWCSFVYRRPNNFQMHHFHTGIRNPNIVQEGKWSNVTRVNWFLSRL